MSDHKCLEKERRKYFRIRYPSGSRQRVKILDKVYEVIAVSKRGKVFESDKRLEAIRFRHKLKTPAKRRAIH